MNKSYAYGYGFALAMDAGEFNESDHPRGKGGKFGSGGGGGGQKSPNYATGEGVLSTSAGRQAEMKAAGTKSASIQDVFQKVGAKASKAGNGEHSFGAKGPEARSFLRDIRQSGWEKTGSEALGNKTTHMYTSGRGQLQVTTSGGKVIHLQGYK